MDCVIYIRWSSAEQAKGSSLERQLRDCRQHAAHRGWQIIAELIDDGVSAFTGEHKLTGALGRFERAVKAGKYVEGTILLCEKLDRLSRQSPQEMFLWMIGLTKAGISIATVDGAREYSHDKFDMAAIIEVIVKAQLSHEESQKKSERLAAAWAAKRRKLETGEKFVMSRRTPAWIRVVDTPPRFVLDVGRAEVVRRIFEETAAGFGKHYIARNLNRDSIETFGRAQGWHASYIQKILRSPAVLGEFQPGRKARGSGRVSVGEAIVDYYPPAINAELHRRARAAMAERSRRHTGRGRKLVNIFSGLARCGECGAKMTFRGKGRKQRSDGSWVNEDYLICDSYQRGRGCENGSHFNYAVWERGVLNPIIFEAMWQQTATNQGEINDLEIELAEKERVLTALKAKIAFTLDLMIESGRHEAREAWAELGSKADAAEKEIAELREQLLILRGQVSPEEHAQRIEALRSAMNDDDEDVRFEARSKIMAAVHSLLTKLTFHGPPGYSATAEIAGERQADITFIPEMNDTDWIMTRIDGEPFAELPWRRELVEHRDVVTPGWQRRAPNGS